MPRKHLTPRGATNERGLYGGMVGAWRNGRGRMLATCQGWEGVVWSGMLHDGDSVISLLRERLGTSEMGFEGAGGG